MSVTLRKYKMLSDLPRVCDFFTANYRLPGWFPTMPWFEYAHTLRWFEYNHAHHFGLWEENGELAAVACFEMHLGEYIPCIKPGYEHLMPEMLDYAERELSKAEGNQRTLDVWIINERDNTQFYLDQGYQPVDSDPILIYPYSNSFPTHPLPEGFSLISLEDEFDPLNLEACFYEGFDHGKWAGPPEDANWQIFACSGPHFRPNLFTIAKAPNGDYACAAGMWVDEVNGFAYLEPLATRPQYRKMGLAHAVLTHAMQKTVALGATYCYCGGTDFYRNMGCRQVGTTTILRKIW